MASRVHRLLGPAAASTFIGLQDSRGRWPSVYFSNQPHLLQCVSWPRQWQLRLPKLNRAAACEDLPRAPTAAEFLSFETYLFDCDGVIWGIPEDDTRTSVATINCLLRLGKRVMFITNNSNKSRAEFLAELRKKGIDFGRRSEEDKLRMMVCTAYTTAQYLKKNGLRRPYIISSATGLLQELRIAGITNYYATVTDTGENPAEFLSHEMSEDSDGVGIVDIVRSNPGVDCIVVGWDLGLTARKVATAVNYIKWHEDLNQMKDDYKPLPLIASAGDCGGVLGTVELEGQTLKLRAIGNGAMTQFIAQCFDPPLEYADMGKPSDILLALLMDKTVYGVDKQTTLMVGDTLQTDIVFGNKGGMATLLVLSGVTSQGESDLPCDDNLRQPTFVMSKLGALIEKGEIGCETVRQ